MREAVPTSGCIDVVPPDTVGVEVNCAACGLRADAAAMLPVGREGYLCRTCWARISRELLTKER